jgi:hypothetical protein
MVQAVLVGELRGPHLKGFVQLHEGVAQVEERERLHRAHFKSGTRSPGETVRGVAVFKSTAISAPASPLTCG